MVTAGAMAVTWSVYHFFLTASAAAIISPRVLVLPNEGLNDASEVLGSRLLTSGPLATSAARAASVFGCRLLVTLVDWLYGDIPANRSAHESFELPDDPNSDAYDGSN